MFSKRIFIAVSIVVLVIAVVVSFVKLSDFIGRKEVAAGEIVSVSSGRQLIPIPIIDAGHGGEDGGAVAADGTKESLINLEISLKLENIFVLLGVQPLMTRESEVIAYPDGAVTIRQRKNADLKSRVEMINNTENAVLISVHQNKYTDSKPFGAQVFYTELGKSYEWGIVTQECLQALNLKNTRKAVEVSKDIYMMRTVSCPSILVECGFLSNPQEANALKTREYQLKVSMSIVAGYLKTFNTRGGIEQ